MGDIIIINTRLCQDRSIRNFGTVAVALSGVGNWCYACPTKNGLPLHGNLMFSDEGVIYLGINYHHTASYEIAKGVNV